jgi:hypothetical protein
VPLRLAGRARAPAGDRGAHPRRARDPIPGGPNVAAGGPRRPGGRRK